MADKTVDSLHPETSAPLLTPPSVGAPEPPVDADGMVAATNLHPTSSQRTIASEVTRELRERAEDASRILGGLVDPIELSKGLAVAAAWSDELVRAEAWVRYVRRAEQAAWQRPLSDLAEGMPVLARRLARTAIRERLPALAHLVAARHEVAVKAARTRASRKGKKEVPPPKP